MRLLILVVTTSLLVSFNSLAFARPGGPDGPKGKVQHGQRPHNPPGAQRWQGHPEAKPVWWGKDKGHKHPNRDRREDIRDRREDIRDRREDRRDRLEDIKDHRNKPPLPPRPYVLPPPAPPA